MFFFFRNNNQCNSPKFIEFTYFLKIFLRYFLANLLQGFKEDSWLNKEIDFKNGVLDENKMIRPTSLFIIVLVLSLELMVMKRFS